MLCTLNSDADADPVESGIPDHRAGPLQLTSGGLFPGFWAADVVGDFCAALLTWGSQRSIIVLQADETEKEVVAGAETAAFLTEREAPTNCLSA